MLNIHIHTYVYTYVYMMDVFGMIRNSEPLFFEIKHN